MNIWRPKYDLIVNFVKSLNKHHEIDGENMYTYWRRNPS